MSSLSTTPAYSNQEGFAGDATWSGDSVTLDKSQASYGRLHNVGTALDAIHDGCVITNILVSGIASCSHVTAGGTQSYSIAFRSSGGAAIVTVSGTGLTTTPTTKSTNGGAGAAPSLVRGGVLRASAFNADTFYDDVTSTISTMTVTITYTDNGMPAMIQFAL